MGREISNRDDVIDSRDVIARIDELEGDRDSLQDDQDAATEALTEVERNADATEQELADRRDAMEVAKNRRANFEEDNGDKLKALCALRDEAEGYVPDWMDGATLIRRSYFVEYCRELVSDIGDMPKEIPSYIEIDWDATAKNLEVDYTTVDFGDVEYLIR